MDDRKAASKAPPRNSAITGWTSTRSLARPSNLNRIGFIGDWNGGVLEGWSDGRETSWWGPAHNRRTRNLWSLILSCSNPPAFAWFFLPWRGRKFEERNQGHARNFTHLALLRKPAGMQSRPTTGRTASPIQNPVRNVVQCF